MGNSHTMFAPAERADAGSILRDAQALNGIIFAEHVVQKIPSVLMVLNKERQVVYKNQPLMNLLGASSDQDVLGKRPGELLDCMHSHENEAGCGTAESCRECGAVNTIIGSQQNKTQIESECRVMSSTGNAYDLRIWASPFTFNKINYTLFVLANIHDEKRRQALERTFFHDIGNILNVILGYSSLVESTEDVELIAQHIGTIHMAGQALVDEITSHKQLLQAENGDLTINISNIESLAMLSEVAELFSADVKWKNRNVVVDKDAKNVEILTDPVLLRRVLGNMIKNALEATADGEKVHISCVQNLSSVTFSVHNPSHMPRSIQLQMFQRSFSTKGQGRGIGTYSMKLFGEQYLKRSCVVLFVRKRWNNFFHFHSNRTLRNIIFTVFQGPDTAIFSLILPELSVFQKRANLLHHITIPKQQGV